MSVAYQNWEAASGPTMGYKMAFQGRNNMCLVLDTLPPDASSYSESFLKVMGGTDTSDGLLLPNSLGLMPQDNVTRGFSSLSICSPHGNMNAKWFSSDEITTPNTAPQLSEYHMQARGSGFSSIGHEGKCRPLSPLPFKHSKAGCMTTSLPDGCHSKAKLAVVVEEKPLEDDDPSSKVCNEIGDNDFETDSSSSLATDSISFLHDMPIDSHVSSGDGSSSTGEAEVQSEYRGFSGSCPGYSPPKKGLSRFYAGKSRSFSCLADVVSLKDLAKPENPYGKKRKSNSGRGSHCRPQLPPLQKGLASISKKLPFTGKSTLALAVAMSAKDDEIDIAREMDFQSSSRVGRWGGSELASRSYSFSDLQGIMGRYAPP